MRKHSRPEDSSDRRDPDGCHVLATSGLSELTLGSEM
jgi:hypothetical protein